MALRDIAVKAEVTRMTVSLALRGHPSISAATRKRIQGFARRMGYAPNPAVADLMGKLRAATYAKNPISIAIITNQVGKISSHDIPTHLAYLKGAIQKASILGYKTEEFRLYHDGMSDRRLSQIISARGIQGVVILPTVDPEGRFELALDCSKFALATTGYSLKRPELNRSCVHHKRLAVDAYRKMMAAGYERIGLALTQEQDIRSEHSWRAGFLAAESLAQVRKKIPPYIVPTLDFAGFRTWYKRYQPDAILHLDVRPPIIDWINRCGARVPEDVGYASLDLQPWMGDISGMCQHSEVLGSAAVDLVVAAMRQNEFGIPDHPKTVMINGTWRQGSSTRRRKLAGIDP